MGDSGGAGSGSFALSSLLLCHETESCLNEEELHDDEDHETNVQAWRSAHDPCFVSVGDDEEEYLSELVRRETHRVGSVPDEPASSFAGCTVPGSVWFRWARLDAIDWIIHTGAKFGFEHQTVYVGISYFDLFLSRRSIDEGKTWAIRLLSVACLSLASKMEECRVPGLSEFPSEDYVFEAKVIQRMEFLVLTTLDWRMNLVTPFTYLHYFVFKFIKNEPFANGLSSRISESLLEMTKEIRLKDHRPWVVSAAAVLASSFSKSTREDFGTKLSSLPWWISSENENVYSCYRIMQEMEESRQRTPESAISREKQLVNPIGEDSCLESGSVSKRRLSFDGSDDFSPAKKVRRS
ncbi:PREDICTED: cyclin-D5-1 isoform X2 [Tarenaya hassleriana]|uniref:cyclin-D5-1 isoform X2 n=1 Tax=Tarenaya hassleriana TaxID=28532 RepID=UPI00053C4029|nr:PREDICTED: cyclin-D5-1 isoform X2 [Tarenaya hassleriana]